MSRTARRQRERVEKLVISRVEGMWVLPAHAIEAGEKAYEEATVNKLHDAIDAILDAYLDGMANI